MADIDGFTAEVLQGLALLLADTHPDLTYRPPGAAYKAGEAPITFGSQHPTANTSLCITPYDDVALDLSAMHLFVQVRTRWPDYLGGLAQTDRNRNALHDHRYVRLGAATASRIRQTSFLPLGADTNGRHEWTQNYRLLLNRPAQQPTP